MRAYHSHPINMFIYILKGSYLDYSIDEKGNKRIQSFKAGQFRTIRRDHRHYIEVLDNPTWTLLFTWGSPKRWAFWDKLTLKKKTRDKYFIENGHHICDN
jgi:NDP-sugar pyrophosphorylase family protein